MSSSWHTVNIYIYKNWLCIDWNLQFLLKHWKNTAGTNRLKINCYVFNEFSGRGWSVRLRAPDWSPAQRSSTKCGVSAWDREASIMRRTWPTIDCCGMGEKNITKNFFMQLLAWKSLDITANLAQTWPVTLFKISASPDCMSFSSSKDKQRQSIQDSCETDWEFWQQLGKGFNPLNPELNPICYLLALLGAHHFLHVSRIRVKLLTLRRLMSYIYGAPILDVSRSHTTTQHSR